MSIINNIKPSFTHNALSKALSDIGNNIAHSEELLTNVMLDKQSNPEAAIFALSEVSMQIETTTAVLNKAIEAYNEVIKMNI